MTDVAAVTKVSAVTASPIAAAQTAPTFNSLFSDQDRRTAVDPVVVALWSVPASVPQPHGAQAAPPPAVEPQVKSSSTGASRLDLFQDIRPNARALFGGSP